MSEIKPDQTLNLKGVPCPLNFVKTKLKLEEISVGKILEVILDDGDPIKNVCSSVKEEGHQIIKIENIDNYWKLLIKKK